MALVPYQNPEDLAPEYRSLLDRPINLFRGFANSPAALAHFHPFGEWIRWDCELDGRLRELAILEVGFLTASEYEFTHHVVISRQFGVTDEDIDNLIAFTRGEETTLSDLDLLVLTAARELTIDRTLTDDTANALIKELGHARFTDVVVISAFYNMVVRVLGGLRIDNEPEYAQVLERFPLDPPRV